MSRPRMTKAEKYAAKKKREEEEAKARENQQRANEIEGVTALNFYEKMAANNEPYTPQAVGWGTRESQDCRLLKFSGFIGKTQSVLDVGCGDGHLCSILLGTNGYKGIDSCTESVKRAESKYPDREFMCGDFYDMPTDRLGQHDWVVASGFFAVKGASEADDLEKLMRAVNKMARLSEVGVMFNVLSDRTPNRKNPMMRYFDVGKVYAFANSLWRDSQPAFGFAGYLPNDFTVVMYR